MKLKLITYLLLLNSIIYAQEAFEAKYIVKFKSTNFDSIYENNKKLKKLKKDFYINLFKKNEEKLIALSKKASLSLIFNKEESVFSIGEILSIKESREFRLFKANIGLYGEYYTDISNTLESKNSYGQDFIVHLPKFKWKITNDRKKIDKYTCYRATTIKEVKNSNGKHRVKIVAWFTPQLPYNFGPKEFNGLPGLILELNEGDNLIFRLKELKKIKKREIKKPTKGKKITLKEFIALSKKMYENRGN